MSPYPRPAPARVDSAKALSRLGELAPELREALLAWGQAHGRHQIPWKLTATGEPACPGERLDPYPIWVAEVMLQQTQVQVMLPYWRRWMAAFPSVEALAAASEHDVLLLWQGLRLMLCV